jgi:hypothetical protein
MQNETEPPVTRGTDLSAHAPRMAPYQRVTCQAAQSLGFVAHFSPPVPLESPWCLVALERR